MKSSAKCLKSLATFLCYNKANVVPISHGICNTPQTWINVIYGSSRKVQQQLHIEECDFTKLILSRIFYLVFSAVWATILLQNIKLKNLLLNRLLSNFKLEKHRRILLFYLRQRFQISDKIFNLVLFQLFDNFSSPFCYYCASLFYSKLLHLLITAVLFTERKWDSKPGYQPTKAVISRKGLKSL